MHGDEVVYCIRMHIRVPKGTLLVFNHVATCAVVLDWFEQKRCRPTGLANRWCTLAILLIPSLSSLLYRRCSCVCHDRIDPSWLPTRALMCNHVAVCMTVQGPSQRHLYEAHGTYTNMMSCSRLFALQITTGKSVPLSCRLSTSHTQASSHLYWSRPT